LKRLKQKKKKKEKKKKNRDNYGTTSEKVETCVDTLIEVLNTIEKNILSVVLELSIEKYK